MDSISKFKSAILLSLILICIQSCVKDDDYKIPLVECPTVQANITIKELKDRVTSNHINLDDNGNIKDDYLVEGFVVSSDETGNIYKNLMLQNASNNGSDGIQFVSDLDKLYSFYPVGSKIQIHLKGFKVANDRGTIKIGSSKGDYSVNNISVAEINSKILKTCDPILEIKPRIFKNIKDALRSENINTLVTIENVQFVDPNKYKIYSNKDFVIGTQTQVNVPLEDKQGNKVSLRNSLYAKWKDTSLPIGSGAITVIVSRYESTWQLYIRDTDDVVFNKNRFEGEGDSPDPDPDPLDPLENEIEAKNLLFLGSDFNEWNIFLNSLNSKGLIKAGYATNAINLGRENTNALQIKGSAKANDNVFTSIVNNSIPDKPTRITFYVKGTSQKTLSLNVFLKDGTYTVFNIGDLNDQSVKINSVKSNQYKGIIDTKNKWVLVTLNIQNLDIQNVKGKDLFSLKVGSAVVYDLIIDNIKID